jgi:hypothetical protein
LVAVLFLSALLLVEEPAEAAEAPTKAIRFPVEGPVRFRNDWLEPRDGGARQHLGNDLFGEKLQRLLAPVDGRVTSVVSGTARAGNQLTIQGTDGWRYLYVHINNDAPGTDDDTNPAEWAFAPGIGVGSVVRAGQHIGYLGDSGNAEEEAPQLHFEIRRPDNTAINPYPSLLVAGGRDPATTCSAIVRPPATPTRAAGAGTWVLGRDGGTFAFGDAPYRGGLGGTRLVSPPVDLVSSRGGGYWVLAGDGGVFAFGAPYLGSMGGRRLAQPIVSGAATPSGGGYWLVASDGGVFSFGDAAFWGSTGAIRLVRPVVGMATAGAAGSGYWLVASDGGVFAFGTAPFLGSLGATPGVEIVGMAATPDGQGYWLLGSDGGVFAYGSAQWWGAVPASGACGRMRAVSMAASATGQGYWIQLDDGRTFAFGDAPDHGDSARAGISTPAIAVFSSP